MNKPPPQLEVITSLFDAVYPSFAMLAGMELDLFTPLKDGPLTVKQLAEAIDVQASRLGPLLYALVVAGLLDIEGDVFSNTIEADRYLVRGNPAYLGEMHQLTFNNWSKLLKTAETIRSGSPPDHYDYHSDSPDELGALLRGLIPGVLEDARRLMDWYDFSAYDSLLDIGGGSGALAISMVQAFPRLMATVVDLPSVTRITRQFIKEAKATDRVNVIAADAVRNPLAGTYDAVVARHLTQVLSADDNRSLLSNLAAVLNPGGVLHLIGWVLDNSRTTPENTVGYNLILLNAYEDGRAYTEDEYFSWLTRAGFVASERVVMPNGASIVTARKPI